MRNTRASQVRIAAVALVVSVASFACSSESDEPTTPTAMADGGVDPATQGPRELNIMQWAHFVPEYVKWTDDFSQKWAKDNKVTMTLEWIPSADLIKRLKAALADENGADLIEITTPVPQFQKDLEPVNDLVEELNKKYGPQLELCAKGTYNPNTKEYWGFGHSWVPNPDLYRKKAWADAGFPNGPETWEDLAKGGAAILGAMGMGPRVVLGIGPENDSEKSLRGLLWAYGANEQDENEKVTINSEETRAAMRAMKKVYDDAIRLPMVGTPMWNTGSNNAAYIAGTASYLVNPISAYRTAQVEKADLADDTGIRAPVKGSTGKGYATIGNVPIFVIPKKSKNKAAAKEYLRHLMKNYSESVYNSKMFNMPCWEATTPQMFEAGGWLETDPFAPAANPGQKGRLAVLKNAASWTRAYGWPGTSNAAIGDIIEQHVIPDMFKAYIFGGMPIDDAVKAAEARMNKIFEDQRAAGLVR